MACHSLLLSKPGLRVGRIDNLPEAVTAAPQGELRLEPNKEVQFTSESFVARGAGIPMVSKWFQRRAQQRPSGSLADGIGGMNRLEMQQLEFVLRV